MSSRTIRGVVSVAGGKFGVLLLGIIITPILVRILGSELYGDYAFVMSIFTVSITLVHAGISAGIRKFIAEDRSDHQWEDHVFAFYGRLGLSLAIAGAVTLTLIGIFVPVDHYFGEEFVLYFLLLAIMLLANQVYYISRYTLMGLHLEHRSEPLEVVKRGLFGVVGLTLAYIGFDIAGVLVGTAIATTVAGLLAFWFLRRHIRIEGLFRPVPKDFPRYNLIQFNALNTVFVLLTISLYNVDILLLQPISGSHETGLYKAVLVVTGFIWLVPKAIQIVFIHSSSELWSKNQLASITSMTSKAVRFSLLFTLLLTIGIATLSVDFMEIYFGSDFVEAVPALLFLLPGVVAFAIARPIYAVGQGKGRLRLLIIATGAAAVLNLILNLLLIPRYGITGAAAATSIGYGSMVVFHGSVALRLGYNPFHDLRVFRVATTAVCAAIPIYLVAYLVESSILSLLIVPVVGLLVFTILALRIRAVDSSEMAPILELFPSSISGISLRVLDAIAHG